jgi:hypothetical protein
MAKRKSPYFSHDADARHDPKILTLRSKYGFEGYGWWWTVVEIMRTQDGYHIPCDVDSLAGLSVECSTTAGKITEFISDCIRWKLLVTDDKFFWSDTLMARMELMEEKSKKARDSVGVRWGNEPDTNVIRTYNERDTSVIQLKDKSPSGKESVITLSPDPDALHAQDPEQIRAILAGQFGGKE